MIFICAVVGIFLVCALLTPFFFGSGGFLAAGASINSPDRLERVKAAVLKRFLEDEAAHAKGDLSKLEWQKRRDFLAHRYVDAARRLDFLQHVQSANRAASGGEEGAHAT